MKTGGGTNGGTRGAAAIAFQALEPSAWFTAETAFAPKSVANHE